MIIIICVELFHRYKKTKLIKNKSNHHKNEKKQVQFDYFYKIIRPLSLKIYEKFETSRWIIQKNREFRILYNLNEYEEKLLSHISALIISVVSALIISLVLISIRYSESLIFISVSFPIILPIAVDMNVSKKAKERISRINIGLSEMIFQISILVSAGISIQNSVKEVYKIYPQDSDMRMLWDIVYYEVERGRGFLESLASAVEIFRLRNLNKLYNILKSGIEKGISNVSEKLLELAEDCSRDIEFDIRKLAEKLSTKMLAPLMVSLIGIMVMLIIPVVIQL